MNLYEALGIDKSAPPDAVKRAFRKAAKAAHPDTGGDEETFAMICLAKDVLTDEERRAKYDRTGTIDEGGPDQTEAMAMQIVMQAIGYVLGEIEKLGANFEAFDIISNALRKIRSDIAVMRSQSKALASDAAKQRRIAKRFKPKKGKPNRISIMFENTARSLDEMAEKALKGVAPCELAIKILEDHTFQCNPSAYDEPAPSPFMFFRS